MNKELSIETINDDLVKLKYDNCLDFSYYDMISLLRLLSKYNLNYIWLASNNIIPIVRDLERVGERDAFKYIRDFVKNNWW
ncbi:Uncharacterised protein [Campylobacter hyointestinalis]|uniref:Uncharacterized protein n=2 Tax=Campylobacter fetus TaxID=196 RepID=A0A825BE87_CAMFE|nr:MULTISPECIES: hypothetical protein [Campylobacter]CBH51835.1 hypothetical protein [Campylobacter fetus subsp. fetus]EAI8859300.1 hypothetical protein [Campylobacter fetus]EGK8193109.1 hypothetical protein [Campylobacter fetus]QMS68027.1 hypothetical protein GZ984_006040 [Campylobacter fetus]CUU92187.1 Uncharacterised protein [Campylobacter hyointestinalis]